MSAETIISERLLLIGVPESLLCKAVSLAGTFARDWNISEYSGRHRAVAYRFGDNAFLLWSSLSGKQICVRYSPCSLA